MLRKTQCSSGQHKNQSFKITVVLSTHFLKFWSLKDGDFIMLFQGHMTENYLMFGYGCMTDSFSCSLLSYRVLSILTLRFSNLSIHYLGCTRHGKKSQCNSDKLGKAWSGDQRTHLQSSDHKLSELSQCYFEITKYFLILVSLSFTLNKNVAIWFV